jgi:hypothetical protein
MGPLNPFLPLLIVLPLIAFWVWMFDDMLKNPRLPSLLNNPARLTGDTRTDWTVAFVILNVFAAVLYYANVYRWRR